MKEVFLRLTCVDRTDRCGFGNIFVFIINIINNFTQIFLRFHITKSIYFVWNMQ